MMATNQHIISSGNNQSSKYSKIVDKIFSCVNEHLMILINQMLNSADKKLFDLAEQATSNEDQMKFMDCTRIFRTDKNDIRHHFFINLNNSLTASKINLTPSDNDELSLVDQDEMEEMVAITTMHAKAMNLFGDEVNNLEARLEYLELMCNESIDKESLDPKHICEVFQKTIENIDIDIEVKLVFYKLFDQEVCSKLDVMYKTVNQIFIDNGVLPAIILKTTKQEEIETDEDEVSTQVASYYDPEKKIETDFIPRTNKDFTRIVNEFMSGEMTMTGEELQLPESFLRTPTQRDLNGKNCYQRKEVVKALSSLQRKITSLNKDTENLTAEQIKQELVADISKEHGGIVDKQVNLLDERSIDFVGMMFGAIADDDTVSEIMTNLIYHLQIPVMKVAMIDRSLFESETHPARATVDLLTTAGMGINIKEDHLYHELEEIVDSILDKFDIDIVTFEKAVDDLENIIKKEERLTTETEREQQKKILQEHARSIVISQLKMVSCEKQIPDKIRPLVLKHWSTLMLNRYIRHGRNSEQWLQSVMLLKLLLKCIQPIKYASQYNLVKKNHMALIETVDDELNHTQQDKNNINKQIVELKSYFIQMIDDYGLKIVDNNDSRGLNEVLDETMSEASVDNIEDELQHVQQQTEIAKQKIARLPSTTKPGVWYEIYNGEDKPIRRLKLSVILTDAAQLIFVDRRGIKIIEKDAEDFAKELEENRSRILADHSAFEQALGKVITALAA
ncbi:DUF1631 family protein [Cardiobacterium sp. AH-315-I02]|nr:DUF1631 family protein [Cardiobacterium sp. AH-315-I02]